MDRIIVLDKGKIVEDDSHEELLNADGYYQKMWEMQAGGFLLSDLEESLNESAEGNIDYYN